MDHSALVAAAVALARDGWQIFPCRSDKTPACRNGCKDATADPQRVHNLFLAARGATMIGLATGPVSGIAVLDVDPLGLPWLRAQVAKYRLPVTRTHQTPRGGMHLLFRNPVPSIRNSASKIARGVDTRGDGGYIVVPPSDGYRHISGTTIKPFPEWLQLILTARRPKPAIAPDSGNGGGQADTLARFIERSPQGERNNRLFWAACTGVREGYDLRVIAAAAEGAGLNAKEIALTIASARRTVRS